MMRILLSLGLFGIVGYNGSCSAESSAPDEGERIVLLGNGLGERMLYYPHFETELFRRFPDSDLVVRNICHPGDTPAYRPRAGNRLQWAFPGGESLRPEFVEHYGNGSYPVPDGWLSQLETDSILAFFGYNESFDGLDGVEKFRIELEAFVDHTLRQRYNGKSAPKLTLVSPIAFEDLSSDRDLPDGLRENARLALYTAAMEQVARDRGVGFVDLFTATKQSYLKSKERLTINGFLPNDRGYRLIADILIEGLYGDVAVSSSANRDRLYAAVEDRNWMWMNDYRILNGLHVYGRRFEPYGPDNYPQEIEKIREMTALRDGVIHSMAQGEAAGTAADDSQTLQLDVIESNYDRPIKFLNVDQAIDRFTLADGFAIDLFASESEFPDLRNPVQMSFDAKGRLWVAVVPSYPHYNPGDGRPNDKLLIFEDTDGDGRANKQIVYADRLHMPMGFELASEGVYLAAQPNLVLLIDDDGDDRADRREIVLSGFDSHDSHHAISAFCADASGAFYLGEGRFLHSQVETPYGPRRGMRGGIWRFDPNSWRLERSMQTDLDNPWGIAFDEWGQCFVADASSGQNWWMTPLAAKVPRGYDIEKFNQFTTHKVRPTAGIEFVSTRHFPEEMQGDYLINNTIGFLGTKDHIVREEGSGYTGELRQNLVNSTDPNFRPCELEFGPDGALYIVDWHNPLIGHKQHSSRDPKRDRDHGRIYRMTFPGRDLVEPAKIADATIPELLDNLKLPEYRSRYRTRRELRGRPSVDVIPAVREWGSALDPDDPKYDRHLLEALWATWAQNEVDPELLKKCLESDDHRCRAGAVSVLRHSGQNLSERHELLLAAADDPHARVRLEAVVAASWQDDVKGAEIVLSSLKHPIEDWMPRAYEAALTTLADDIQEVDRQSLSDNPNALNYLSGGFSIPMSASAKDRRKELRNRSKLSDKEMRKLFDVGREVYHRSGSCITCHDDNGQGSVEGVYPPLNDRRWINENDERLIRIVLKGLWGPIKVKGKVYDPANGVPPMTAFESILSDREIAAVLTYIRANFASTKKKKNSVDGIAPEAVARVREAVMDKKGFYTVKELLEEFPLK